jgi:outer membrane protein assembly factor BamB
LSNIINSLVFLGFNSRVVALDRKKGDIVWQWRAKTPKSAGYVSLLVLDSSQLIVSVNGYTYCLDPLTGEERWYNELKGLGTGVTSIAAFGTYSLHDMLIAAAAADAAAAAAAS